jgi:hypothetical protein
VTDATGSSTPAEAAPATGAERLDRAHADGRAAALRGEEAAPGCTTTPEGRAFLRGYVEGARARATRREE